MQPRLGSRQTYCWSVRKWCVILHLNRVVFCKFPRIESDAADIVWPSFIWPSKRCGLNFYADCYVSYRGGQKHCCFFHFVFTMFYCKNSAVIYKLGHKIGPKQPFLQCFQCSDIRKPSNISLFAVLFSFLSIFPLPNTSQNHPKFHLNTLLVSLLPKIVQKTRKHQQNRGSVRKKIECSA